MLSGTADLPGTQRRMVRSSTPKIVQLPVVTILNDLAVSFQEVVPVWTEEAEVVEALANPRRTEWTLIRMRLSRRKVEKRWRPQRRSNSM
jgi:hypothetical protein